MKYSLLLLCLVLCLSLVSCVRFIDPNEPAESEKESESAEVTDPATDPETFPETDPASDPETDPETETEPDGETLPNDPDPDHTARY